MPVDTYTTVIVLTPAMLREIADDLEREGLDYARTVESLNGDMVDIITPETAEHWFDAY